MNTPQKMTPQELEAQGERVRAIVFEKLGGAMKEEFGDATPLLLTQCAEACLDVAIDYMLRGTPSIKGETFDDKVSRIKRVIFESVEKKNVEQGGGGG